MNPEIDPRRGSPAAVASSATSSTADTRWVEWQRHADAREAIWHRRAVVTAAVLGAGLTVWLVMELYLG